MLIAILIGGWNGSTCITVVALLGDGTELLRGASDFNVFYQDDGALIRGLYSCPQDSCFECERMKIDREGAGGPGELAPALLCMGDRGNQSAGKQKRDQTHMTAWRRTSTPLAHDLALARHTWVRAIRRHPESRHPVISCDKSLSSIPHQKTRSVHRGIRKAPERVCFVGQEVRRDEGIFVWPNDLPAEGAMSSAGLDPLHS
ncbi:MAG TPA: hypothetical protein VGQ24_08825 [Gemmatimonadales bacterium]|nr:hypothetical protein [Gemmatimonadales bacterium]